MIDYKYADLYYEDSINKQLKIEAEDGSVITNEDIFSEAMTLDESLCSDSSLNFGCCEASKFYIKIANRFTQMYGQWLTVTETIDGNEDDPFLFGHYKVHSDNPTADRTYREITAYDAMYDIINADGVDVADWYNEILPDYDSTVTLKKFRQSFLEHLGIEEIDANLVNDNMIVEKTIETSSLSGQRVITAICEINGVFAHITREGKLEYIQLEPIEEDKAFDIPINMYSDYEDFETQTINCLQIREDDTDPGVVYGSGANRYIISGNFLLYGKTTEDLITITANLYPVINNISYRPATITAPGNPCIEVGDVIHLSTTYQEIYTYVLKRNFSGIQALTDTYTSDGTETYVDDGGSLQEKIEQIKSRTSELANEVKENTEAISIAVEMVEADYANFLILEAEVANIQTLFAEYATIEELEAQIARINELYVDYEEVNTLVAESIEAVYADIESLTANLAEIRALFADYVTVDSLTALVAYIDTEFVSNATISELLAGYAKIEDLDAVTANITNLNADVANIVSVLSGEIGTGLLESIHLTTDNAVIDEAVITEALIGTVLAEIIQSNIIYTDYITIMSENGGIVIAGTTMQFSDSSGTIRLQLGEDADGNFTFVLYDETGTGIMIDSEGIHASAVPDGLIVNDMVADDAAIAGSKLDIESVSQCLNDAGLLEINAAKVIINGETLDYQLTQITQQIEDLEMAGIDTIENWYAIGGPDEPPCEPGESFANAILGELILGESILGCVSWTTESLTSHGEDEYVWFTQKITYIDGTVVWTTPTLLTDDYVRNAITIQQTELSVIQGQIQAKIWLSDIESATDEIWGDLSIITDQYSELTLLIDTIDMRVGEMQTTYGDYFTELYSQVESITLEQGQITAKVEEIDTKTANAITEGTPYYAVSENPNYYPPHEVAEDERSILGELILGSAILGVSGNDWTTEQPEYKEGQYIWISYYRERVDGTTYWTTPTLLTDEWLRKNASEMSEKYSQLVLTIDSALLEVYSAISTVEGNVTELDASIREYVDEVSADILSEVSGLYVTESEFTSATSSIEQYIDQQTASIRLDLEYYATTADLDYSIYVATNEINQTIEDTVDGMQNTILIEVSNTYSTKDESVSKIDTYYAVSNNPDSPEDKEDGEVLFDDDFASTTWNKFASSSTIEKVNDDILGEHYRIVRDNSSSSSIYIYRSAYSEYLSEMIYDVEIEAATDAGFENDVVIMFGISENYISVNEELKSNEWTAIKRALAVSSDTSALFRIYNSSDLNVPLLVKSAKVTQYRQVEANWSTDYPEVEAGQYLWVRYLITYTDGHTEWVDPLCVSTDVDLSGYPTTTEMNAAIQAQVTDAEAIILSTVSGTYVTNGEFTESISSIEQYVSESLSSITLSVSGGLGGTASIVMTAGDTSTSANLDLSNVREAFRDETSSSITISGGTITFNSGTFVVNSTYFSVTSTGIITATSGTIGGWSLTSSKIYGGGTTANGGDGKYSRVAVVQLPTDNSTWVFAAGGQYHSSYSDCPFRVDKDGNLYATSAEITGTITASSGTIGGWTITGSKIYGGTSSTGVAVMQVPSSSITNVFAAGGSSHDDYGTCPFRVTKAGALYATNASISGSITSSTISGTTMNGGTIYGTNYYTTTGNDSSIFTDGFRIYETSITSYGTSVIRFRSSSDSSSNLMRIRAMTESSGVAISQQSIATELYLIVDNLSVTGSKSRQVETKDYGAKLTQAYETATPYFGDIGSGETDENGLCYVSIDNVFAETINTTEYVVFLQKEGQGDLWVKEKEADYFIIEGSPNLSFAWELKAVQKDYETIYMNDPGIFGGGLPDGELEEDFDDELNEIDKELEDLLAV